MIDSDVIVVGSGATGSMAAQTIIEGGGSVLMLDVGRTDRHYAGLLPEQDYLEIRRTDPEQQRMSTYIGIFRQPGHFAEQALLKDGARKLRAIYGGQCSEREVEENIKRLSEPGALTATQPFQPGGT